MKIKKKGLCWDQLTIWTVQTFNKQSFGLTQSVIFQTIVWNQPRKAEPVKTSSGPPVCPLTPQSHTHSQSLTTTHTPAPPGVRTLLFMCIILFSSEPHSSFCNSDVIFIYLFILFPPWALFSFKGGSLLSLLAYRMPRRRFSTGGDEESWSQSLQRVRASLVSICSSSASN